MSKITKNFCRKARDGVLAPFYKALCKRYNLFCCGSRTGIFLWEFDPAPVDGDGTYANWWFRGFPDGTTYVVDVWASNPATAPPSVPGGAPDTTITLTTTNGLIAAGGYNDTTVGTSPSPSTENDYYKYSITTPSGNTYIFWYYLHEEGLGEGEPGLVSQVSFDGGTSWSQAEGYKGHIYFPEKIV